MKLQRQCWLCMKPAAAASPPTRSSFTDMNQLFHPAFWPQGITPRPRPPSHRGLERRPHGCNARTHAYLIFVSLLSPGVDFPRTTVLLPDRANAHHPGGFGAIRRSGLQADQGPSVQQILDFGSIGPKVEIVDDVSR